MFLSLDYNFQTDAGFILFSYGRLLNSSLATNNAESAGKVFAQANERASMLHILSH